MSKEQLRVQVPKDISSRQSTQSRVRMNRLNKMMAASASQNQASLSRKNNQEFMTNQEVINEINNYSNPLLINQSLAQSYQTETSSAYKQQQPIWM